MVQLKIFQTIWRRQKPHLIELMLHQVDVERSADQWGLLRSVTSFEDPSPAAKHEP
jgi:hypothetical protein